MARAFRSRSSDSRQHRQDGNQPDGAGGLPRFERCQRERREGGDVAERNEDDPCDREDEDEADGDQGIDRTARNSVDRENCGDLSVHVATCSPSPPESLFR